MNKAARACLVPALLGTLACATRTPRALGPPTPGAGFRVPSLIQVRVAGQATALAFEDYVAGCVVAELGSIAAPPETAARLRDVQAILCRTYAVTAAGRHAREGFDVCDSTHCQVYRPVPATAIGRLSREAALRTAGMLLTFHGTPIRPLYHASCGGRTSRANDVWEGPGQPYLVSRPDRSCVRPSRWQFRVEMSALLDALPVATASPLGGTLKSLRVVRRDAAGRAARVRLAGRRGVELPGDTFRLAVIGRFGAQSLRSTLFSVRKSGSALEFTGRGDGHGVGLCQAGALARAAAGQDAGRILTYYYPGTTLRRFAD